MDAASAERSTAQGNGRQAARDSSSYAFFRSGFEPPFGIFPVRSQYRAASVCRQWRDVSPRDQYWHRSTPLSVPGRLRVRSSG
ncbi:F-box protein [Burkholderia sp. Bp9002]|nr:F-box protein [Burkholderia sp. Bp9002]